MQQSKFGLPVTATGSTQKNDKYDPEYNTPGMSMYAILHKTLQKTIALAERLRMLFMKKFYEYVRQCPLQQRCR